MERSNQNLLDAFAEALRQCRHEAGLSQEELAARADLSARHISFLETGKRQPSLTVLAALSRGLGMNLAQFAEVIEGKVCPDNA